METIDFDKILVRSAFCCMATDGEIDKKEISSIKKLCEESTLMSDFNFLEEINLLVDEINSKGKQFIISHMNMLSNSKLTEEEELEILNFCYHTIMADDEIHYYTYDSTNVELAEEPVRYISN